MQTVYLVVWHDRHSDDRFSVFTNKDAAKARAYEHITNYSDRYAFEEHEHYYGDWCLFCSDDYYVSVEALKLMEESL